MKKLLVLMMTLVMTLSLAACGGDTGATEPAAAPSAPEATTPEAEAAQDITLISTEVLNTSLLVPDNFGEFVDNSGFAVAVDADKAASITVSPAMVPVEGIEDITEEYMVNMVADKFSNLEVLSFDNPVSLAGVDAVTFLFSGDSASGQNRTLCYVMLFFSIDGQNYQQQFIFTYNTGANTALEAALTEVIESISLQ